MLLYKSIGKSAFSGNLQPFQDFLTTQIGISRSVYTINSKAAISLTFDLHCHAVAAPFLFRIVVSFEDIANRLSVRFNLDFSIH